MLDKLNDDQQEQLNLALATLYHLLLAFEQTPNDTALAQTLYAKLVPLCLPLLLEAFTKEEIGVKGRSRTFVLFHLMVRGIAWADGIDNSLVHQCLDETFESWMALFLQILQSHSSRNFIVKKNALKCLTVIFRDLINYSRNSINSILRPAWKLLN